MVFGNSLGVSVIPWTPVESDIFEKVTIIFFKPIS